MDLLRDPMWQFAGAVLSILAIAVSIILYLLQRNRKELSYFIISKTPLVNVAKDVGDKLEIRFDGKVVRAVHLIVVRIFNSGNVPILPIDFQRDVSIVFDENAK